MRAFQLAGVDLAWMSNRNPTAIAYGSLSNRDLTIVGIAQNLFGVESVIGSINTRPELHGITIDAPLIIKNSTGQRACEKLIGKSYGARKAACHTSNLNKYPDADSVKLSTHLEGMGFKHISSAEKPWQLECYPHPAIIEIFDLEERHLYKKGSVDSKRQGQSSLAGMLISLNQSEVLRLRIPSEFEEFLDAERIKALGGSNLKHNEDVLDAIVCLYIAGLYQIGIRQSVFGDTAEGYIYVPQQTCI